jgi:hypothetical protein
MNPYNHNPFKTEDRREPRNEHDAHRELLATIRDIAALQTIAGDLLEIQRQPKLRIVKND